MSEHAASRALSAARRERQDVGLRFILILLAGIALVLLLLMLLAYMIYPGEIADKRFAGPFPDFPSPTLQPNPVLDWKAFYSREMARLNGVGWQDRAAGTVHIPIDQAMRAVAAEGIKGWPAGSTTVSGGDRR